MKYFHKMDPAVVTMYLSLHPDRLLLAERANEFPVLSSLSVALFSSVAGSIGIII